MRGAKICDCLVCLRQLGGELVVRDPRLGDVTLERAAGLRALVVVGACGFADLVVVCGSQLGDLALVRRAKAEAALRHIAAAAGLSRDVADIAGRALAAG